LALIIMALANDRRSPIRNDAFGGFTKKQLYPHDQTRIQAKFQMLNAVIEITGFLNARLVWRGGHG
jgi:hypothetical protein